MDNERDHRRSRFYESLPMTARSMDTISAGSMSWQQNASLIVGLGLLIAAVAGWWSALQSNGQIFGLFAFNAWNTWLALVAAGLALGAGLSALSARAIWTLLAVGYAGMFVVGLIVQGGQVIGLFANNYNNVWAYAIFAIIFGYLAASRASGEAP